MTPAVADSGHAQVPHQAVHCAERHGVTLPAQPMGQLPGTLNPFGGALGGQQLVEDHGALRVRVGIGWEVCFHLRLKRGTRSYVAEPVKPILTRPIRPSRIRRASSAAASTPVRIHRARSRYRSPARPGGPFVSTGSAVAPRPRSELLICWANGDCAMCRRCAVPPDRSSTPRRLRRSTAGGAAPWRECTRDLRLCPDASSRPLRATAATTSG